MFEATPFTRTVHPDKTAEQYRTDIACVCVNLNRHVDLAKGSTGRGDGGYQSRRLGGHDNGLSQRADGRAYLRGEALRGEAIAAAEVALREERAGRPPGRGCRLASSRRGKPALGEGTKPCPRRQRDGSESARASIGTATGSGHGQVAPARRAATEKRFPFDTPFREIKAWQEAIRADFR